jgi:hypothetical protein
MVRLEKRNLGIEEPSRPNYSRTFIHRGPNVHYMLQHTLSNDQIDSVTCKRQIYDLGNYVNSLAAFNINV